MTQFYKHYKNKPYKYIGTVRHSESLESLVLYETRYPNDLAKLWVRPEKMFHEEIEVDGQKRPRFAPVPAVYTTTADKADWGFAQKIFSTLTEEKIRQKFQAHPNQLLLTARIEGQVVGFKWGYALDPKTFYSWLGGVDPQWRDLGLAQEMIDHQEKWCRDQGFEKIQTKGMNQWPEMISLNLKNGYQITGIQGSGDKLKILMEKRI